MPFTPLHLGAGAAFKALGGPRLSFMVFGGTQVLMDLEPLFGIIRGSSILHGYTHTLLGALLIGFAGALTGRPITNWVFGLLQLRVGPVTWAASFAGAYAGTFSHLLLDGVMHYDMRPFWPITSANPLLSLLHVHHLSRLCILLGLLGGAVLLIKRVPRRGA